MEEKDTKDTKDYVALNLVNSDQSDEMQLKTAGKEETKVKIGNGMGAFYVT